MTVRRRSKTDSKTDLSSTVNVPSGTFSILEKRRRKEKEKG